MKLALEKAFEDIKTRYTYGGMDGNTNGGNTDIFVVKYNSDGVKQWNRSLRFHHIRPEIVFQSGKPESVNTP